MRAVILAAGRGTRLAPYSVDKPKGLLAFCGRSLLQQQLDVYRQCGIDDMVVITGYAAEQFTLAGVCYCHNANFATTNMVESLMTARPWLHGDLLVSYADVLFTTAVLHGLLACATDIAVTVDMAWQRYWEARYGSVTEDTESLVSDGKRIVEIGAPEPGLDRIHGRYVGLLKFSATGIQALIAAYDQAKATHRERPWHSAPTFEQAYMTDLLQEMIDTGTPVYAHLIHGDWLEFDTASDYERYQAWAASGKLKEFYRGADLA